jgi:hypothetical protein
MNVADKGIEGETCYYENDKFCSFVRFRTKRFLSSHDCLTCVPPRHTGTRRHYLAHGVSKSALARQLCINRDTIHQWVLRCGQGRAYARASRQWG